MKYRIIFILIIGLVIISCNQDKEPVVTEEEQTETLQKKELSKDEEEIQNLIRQVLKWGNSKVNLWTLLADDKDSICIGLNLKEHKKNLDELKKTDFFSIEFIENYNQIILTLDKKIQNKEFGNLLVGDLPPFNFASDVNPWCLCQEEPCDPNLWEVDINIIRLSSESGELEYKWGKSVLNADPYWKDFRYKFKVTKENNKWKISYMEGFDFEEGIKGW